MLSVASSIRPGYFAQESTRQGRGGFGASRLGFGASRLRAIAQVALATALAIGGLHGQRTVLAATPPPSGLPAGQSPITSRHMDASRTLATSMPRTESDQAEVDGWPLYRSVRGQRAFNDAMATLAVTRGKPPSVRAFSECPRLACSFIAPRFNRKGWMPAGRLWVSTKEYVLLVVSPREEGVEHYSRHSTRNMQVYVLHDFPNSTRNTDVYDTISSHRGSVFTAFYMSKQAVDADGNSFVVVVQTAPYDVISRHASNYGDAGPGIEVAKNAWDALEPLQSLAGIFITSMVKQEVPHIEVVNHRGREGLPMLEAYNAHIAQHARKRGEKSVTLPFVAAQTQKLHSASVGHIGELINRGASSPQLNLAERAVIPPRGNAGPAPGATATPAPKRQQASVGKNVPAASTVERTDSELSSLAQYLVANLAAMKTDPMLGRIIPQAVDAVTEIDPRDNFVYLLDSSEDLLGWVEPYWSDGHVVEGQYMFVAADRQEQEVTPFQLDLSSPFATRSASIAADPRSGGAFSPGLGSLSRGR